METDMINYLNWRIQALSKENKELKEELNACINQLNEK
jgi:hypothetical protein